MKIGFSKEFLVFVVAVSAACLSVSASANLVQGGDFSSAATNLAPLCRGAYGCSLSLFTEPLTWNRCGRCTVSRSVPDAQNKGCVVHSASVVIGATDDGPGFVVEPSCRYDFSFDVRGSVPAVAVDLVYWTGDDGRKVRRTAKVDIADRSVSAAWAVKTGSFVAPKDARCAALRLSIWSSSRWKSRHQFKVGDYFMFDNVKVVRSSRNLIATNREISSPQAVDMRKTVALGEQFDDLVSYKDGRTPAQARTVFAVRREADALVVEVEAEEPGELAAGNASRVWSGDAVELVFGGADDGRTRTHVAFNPAGAKYTAGSDSIANDGWDLATSMKSNSWRATVRLPFAFLGWKTPKKEVPFNAGRVRPKARTFDVWSARGGFHDVASFGRIAMDGYASLLKAEFGIDAPVANRTEFEARFAAESAARTAARLAKFKEATFSVAPVPTVSDWTQPYLPEEIFAPPERIALKAAVNEIRALPLAVANLTDRAEDYRVVLETEKNDFVGDWGLEGFPAANVVLRRGVRFRDVDGASPTTRFDPLPRLDEAGVVTVPPGEAGLVWCDFDCTGVKPGAYRGRLRVMPLCEPGTCRSKNGSMDYKGKMQTIPVELEVVDAEIPRRAPAYAGYFMGVDSQDALDTAFQIGAECFQVNAWNFKFDRDGDGNLDFSRPKGGTTKVARTVASHVAWARRHGFRPKFSIVYSAIDVCKNLYSCGKDREKFCRFWPQYVKSVKKVMNDAGVPDADYFVEVKDEPKAEMLDELLMAHKLAKEAVPEVRLAMLLASWDLPQKKLEEFVPFSDVWILWRGKFDNAQFRAFAARLAEEGKEVCHYSCDTSMRLPLLGYYRHHAWFAEMHGLAGAYMYQLTDSVGGAGFGFKDFKSIPVAGLFYRSFGRPVPSLRMMALREGFTDVKFIAALRERNRTANDPEIAAFLKSAADDVLVRHVSDNRFPDRIRDRARELLARRPIGINDK